MKMKNPVPNLIEGGGIAAALVCIVLIWLIEYRQDRKMRQRYPDLFDPEEHD